MKYDLSQALAAGRNVPVGPLAFAAGVTPGAIYAAVRRGEVKAVKIGTAIRIPAREAKKLMGIEDAKAS